MKRTRAKLLVLLAWMLAVVLSIGAAGCASSSSGSSGKSLTPTDLAGTPEKNTLKVGISVPDTGYLPVYVAKARTFEIGRAHV